MTLHFWNAPDGVGSHEEVGIHPAGHVTSQRCVRSNQVVSVYNTCEKFLCSGFFLWSARWNWPFLSPQDFGVAWEATFTQVPAREFKKYIINSQVKQKSTLICNIYVMHKKYGYETTVWGEASWHLIQKHASDLPVITPASTPYTAQKIEERVENKDRMSVC